MPPYRVFRLLFRYLLSGAFLAGAVSCSGPGASQQGGYAGASGDAGAVAAHVDGAPAEASSGMGGTSAGAAGSRGSVCHELDTEPNGDRGSAVHRAALSDCDDAATTATGTLAGDDLDVWSFPLLDTLGCLVNPTASTYQVARLCLYPDCPGVLVSCPQGLPSGGGCCGGGVVELAFSCAGAAQDATVWLSVGQEWSIPISADRDCLDYSVDVHF